MTSEPPIDSSVNIKLSGDEALILFEFLSRLCESKTPTFEADAERDVANDIVCMLEEELVSPFRADYDALLQAARTRVRNLHDAP